jgi:glyoxylase-like metal-dependent hydrolase (beta-lactamase superfamily II)
MTDVKVHSVEKNVYQINESDGASLNVDSYLILGNSRAVLIDTLQETETLYQTVRELTDLPLTVLLTHGHPDHAGRSFSDFVQRGIPVYMRHEDLFLLENRIQKEVIEKIHDLSEGMQFDLDGTVLETILCGGHTAGSCVFFDRENSLLYSGDSAGSGAIWMQLPDCLSLSDYCPNIEQLYACMKQYPSLKIYPGHRWQSSVQLGVQYLKDTADLTEELVENREKGKDWQIQFNGNTYHFRSAAKGLMHEYVYDPEHI